MVSKITYEMKRWEWIGVVFLGVLSAIYVSNNIGRWEGKLFPAAKPMQLNPFLLEYNNTVVFGGTSARLRPECSPVKLDWRLGYRGNHNVPVHVDWGPPKKQPNGRFTFTGWVAHMESSEDFSAATYGDVWHQCRIFTKLDENGNAMGGIELPWFTVTEFWN